MGVSPNRSSVQPIEPGYQQSRWRTPELSRKLCWGTWILAVGTVIWDIYNPDKLINGTLVMTVSKTVYYFLAFMIFTFAANYSRKKILEVIGFIAKLKYPGISLGSTGDSPKESKTPGKVNTTGTMPNEQHY